MRNSSDEIVIRMNDRAVISRQPCAHVRFECESLCSSFGLMRRPMPPIAECYAWLRVISHAGMHPRRLEPPTFEQAGERTGAFRWHQPRADRESAIGRPAAEGGNCIYRRWPADGRPGSSSISNDPACRFEPRLDQRPVQAGLDLGRNRLVDAAAKLLPAGSARELQPLPAARLEGLEIQGEGDDLVGKSRPGTSRTLTIVAAAWRGSRAMRS